MTRNFPLSKFLDPCVSIFSGYIIKQYRQIFNSKRWIAAGLQLDFPPGSPAEEGTPPFQGRRLRWRARLPPKLKMGNRQKKPLCRDRPLHRGFVIPIPWRRPAFSSTTNTTSPTSPTSPTSTTRPLPAPLVPLSHCPITPAPPAPGRPAGQAVGSGKRKSGKGRRPGRAPFPHEGIGRCRLLPPPPAGGGAAPSAPPPIAPSAIGSGGGTVGKLAPAAIPPGAACRQRSRRRLPG